MAAMSEWRPIETAPKDGTQLLLCVGGWRFIGWWGQQYGNLYPPSWCEGERGENLQPTHWMPLPDAPEESA